MTLRRPLLLLLGGAGVCALHTQKTQSAVTREDDVAHLADLLGSAKGIKYDPAADEVKEEQREMDAWSKAQYVDDKIVKNTESKTGSSAGDALLQTQAWWSATVKEYALRHGREFGRFLWLWGMFFHGTSYLYVKGLTLDDWPWRKKGPAAHWFLFFEPWLISIYFYAGIWAFCVCCYVFLYDTINFEEDFRSSEAFRSRGYSNGDLIDKARLLNERTSADRDRSHDEKREFVWEAKQQVFCNAFGLVAGALCAAWVALSFVSAQFVGAWVSSSFVAATAVLASFWSGHIFFDNLIWSSDMASAGLTLLLTGLIGVCWVRELWRYLQHSEEKSMLFATFELPEWDRANLVSKLAGIWLASAAGACGWWFFVPYELSKWVPLALLTSGFGPSLDWLTDGYYSYNFAVDVWGDNMTPVGIKPVAPGESPIPKTLVGEVGSFLWKAMNRWERMREFHSRLNSPDSPFTQSIVTSFVEEASGSSWTGFHDAERSNHAQITETVWDHVFCFLPSFGVGILLAGLVMTSAKLVYTGARDKIDEKRTIKEFAFEELWMKHPSVIEWLCAITAGMVWTAACLFTMLSVSYLGFGLATVMFHAWPAVYVFWSVFLFAEVRGRAGRHVFLLAALMVLTGLTILVLVTREDPNPAVALF